MNSLLLDVNNWDLTIDDFGNIALATGAYALAQNVACAVRLFLGEQYYQTDKGIPYDKILGKAVPIAYLTGLIEKQALTVIGVVSAKCIINDFSNRKITGKILFIDTEGAENGISF
jgi:hypothetical protein